MLSAEHTPLPRIDELLRLPEVAAGEPELVAGANGLGREARWAHVVAGTGVAGLLDGGELILTTGAGWPPDDAGLRSLAEELVSVGGTGVAAILLELGRSFDRAPDALIATCEVHDVPLIILHREVRFVQITQRVHQRILAAQNEALQARAEVHAMLTDLGLNRSPVDYVVEQLAATLGAPVVLEGPSHAVIALAGHGQDATTALAPWRDTLDAGPELPEGSERVPVEARGTRWGTLIALPGPPHPAGRRTVLELGAFALALGRLADAEGSQWLRLSSKRVFDVLLGGRYRNDTELETQLAAAGLPFDGRVTIAATLRGVGTFSGHASLERATLETALRRAIAPEGRALIADDTSGTGDTGGSGGSGDSGGSDDTSRDGPALLAIISLPEHDPRGHEAKDRGAPPLAQALSRELEMLVPGPSPQSWRAHLALGAPMTRLRGLVASLEQLRAAGRLSASAETGLVTVQQVDRQALAHLIRGLSGLPEVQEFASDALAPLIEHDRVVGPGHPGDLLRVLQAYLRHPANRSLAASEASLSRSVFYQRLALTEELLGVDLSEGETIATLSVALLARPSSPSSPSSPGSPASSPRSSLSVRGGPVPPPGTPAPSVRPEP